jgi:hypothetical protein
VGDPPGRFLLRQLPPQTGVRLAQSREPSIGAFVIGDHPIMIGRCSRTPAAIILLRSCATKVTGIGGTSIAECAIRLVRS